MSGLAGKEQEFHLIPNHLCPKHYCCYTSQMSHYDLQRRRYCCEPRIKIRFCFCLTPPWNTGCTLKTSFSSYHINPDQLKPHGPKTTKTFYTIPAQFIKTLDLMFFSTLDGQVVSSKRDFFLAKISQTEMANGLMFFSELFSYAASCVWGLAGRAPLSELQRTLHISLLCSVKMKRTQDGPLTQTAVD